MDHCLIITTHGHISSKKINISSHNVWGMAQYSSYVRLGHNTLLLAFPSGQVSLYKVQYPVVDQLPEDDLAQSESVNASTLKWPYSSIYKSTTWICFKIFHNAKRLGAVIYNNKKKTTKTRSCHILTHNTNSKLYV